MHLNGTEWAISSSSSLNRLHHLTHHRFLPYHLDHLFHYHIHPEQAQDQPTTQVNIHPRTQGPRIRENSLGTRLVNIFLQNHKKKIII